MAGATLSPPSHPHSRLAGHDKARGERGTGVSKRNTRTDALHDLPGARNDEVQEPSGQQPHCGRIRLRSVRARSLHKRMFTRIADPSRGKASAETAKHALRSRIAVVEPQPHQTQVAETIPPPASATNELVDQSRVTAGLRRQMSLVCIGLQPDRCPECGTPHPGGSRYMRRCDDCWGRRDAAMLVGA